jgi:hypothetical protein
MAWSAYSAEELTARERVKAAYSQTEALTIMGWGGGSASAWKRSVTINHKTADGWSEDGAEAVVAALEALDPAPDNIAMIETHISGRYAVNWTINTYGDWEKVASEEEE